MNRVAGANAFFNHKQSSFWLTFLSLLSFALRVCCLLIAFIFVGNLSYELFLSSYPVLVVSGVLLGVCLLTAVIVFVQQEMNNTNGEAEQLEIVFKRFSIASSAIIAAFIIGIGAITIYPNIRLQSFLFAYIQKGLEPYLIKPSGRLYAKLQQAKVTEDRKPQAQRTEAKKPRPSASPAKGTRITGFPMAPACVAAGYGGYNECEGHYAIGPDMSFIDQMCRLHPEGAAEYHVGEGYFDAANVPYVEGVVRNFWMKSVLRNACSKTIIIVHNNTNKEMYTPWMDAIDLPDRVIPVPEGTRVVEQRSNGTVLPHSEPFVTTPQTWRVLYYVQPGREVTIEFLAYHE